MVETGGVDRNWIESNVSTGLFLKSKYYTSVVIVCLKSNAIFCQLTGKIQNLKIGILKEGFGLKTSEADVDKKVREAAEQLGTAGGATVEEVSVPMRSDGNWTLWEC